MAGQPSKQTPARVLSEADPCSGLRLEPLIEDLLKTGSCVSNSLFLVESVDANVSISRWHRAVRLMLGDGTLCIQALLSPDLHGLVDNEDVVIGSYVRLVKFSLHYFKAGKLGGKSSDRDGPNEDSQFVYLLVERMISVGWNSAYAEAIEPSTAPPTAHEPQETVEDAQSPGIAGSKLGAPVSHAVVKDLSDGEDEFETMQVSQEKANIRRTQAGEMRDAPPARPGSAHSAAHKLPWASNDPTQPLKLTSLRSIPFLPYKQNWRVNVLAVVTQLSELEASHLPPGQQRVARLADPSTKKQVHLTVFLDPEAFTPEEGSVVLLLGVKNHRFDGGSLKMYANERRVDGATWWFENPTHLDWCDVKGLKAWWQEKQAAVVEA